MSISIATLNVPMKDHLDPKEGSNENNFSIISIIVDFCTKRILMVNIGIVSKRRFQISTAIHFLCTNNANESVIEILVLIAFASQYCP